VQHRHNLGGFGGSGMAGGSTGVLDLGQMLHPESLFPKGLVMMMLSQPIDFLNRGLPLPHRLVGFWHRRPKGCLLLHSCTGMSSGVGCRAKGQGWDILFFIINGHR